MALLKDLKEKYKIPAANFIGHSDIAPKRKNDPNRTFPWKELAKEGYGLWYDEMPLVDVQILDDNFLNIEIPQEIKIEVNDSVIETKIQAAELPALLDVSPMVALKIIGYDVSDMSATIKSFKLHFIQTEVDSTLTDFDLRVLNNLYKKYL